MLSNKSLNTFMLFAATTLVLIGCKKNNDKPGPGPDPKPDPVVTKKIAKVISNDTDSTVITYNAAGLVDKINTTEGSEESGPINFQFTYNADNKLSEISTNVGLRYRFVYEANRLKMTESYFATTKLSENVFTYTNNKITANTLFTAFEKAGGVTKYLPSFRTLYSYDDAGQVIRVTSNSVDTGSNVNTKIDDKQVTQYDSHKNPMKALEALALVTVYEIPGEHNTLKEILYDENGKVKSTTVNTYVYDADKYPVSSTSTETPAEGAPEITKLKFFYK